jgi:AcrR family transcriptional regulator
VVTEQLDRKADTTRQQILRAAAHQFAHKPYSLVSLDDILADAEVTKGAMYFHFRSKHALALEIVEYAAEIGRAGIDDVLARGLSGLETLIDSSYLIAIEDVGDEFARAGFNLLASIGRTDGLQTRVLAAWVAGFAAIARRAIGERDVIDGQDPEDIARALVSLHLGIRQTSDLDEPERLFNDLEKAWLLILPGFATSEGLGYLTQFVRRRTGLAIKRTTEAASDKL